MYILNLLRESGRVLIKTSNIPGKYTVIYTNGADYFKVKAIQNKANPYSIKISHYSSTYSSTNFKIHQGTKNLTFFSSYWYITVASEIDSNIFNSDLYWVYIHIYLYNNIKKENPW